MKRTFAIVTALTIFFNSFASTGKDFPIIDGTQVFFPVGNSGQMISLFELSKISPRQLQSLTGKKMNLIDKLAFRAAQKKLRNHVYADGSLDRNLTNRLNKFYGRKDENSKSFHAGGFLLGALLGWIGLLIAYLINDDYKRRRVKWAWIGLGLQVLVAIILVAADVVILRLN